MKTIPFHSCILLLTSLFAFSANVRASTAPASIVGKKFVLSRPNGSQTYVLTRIFTDESNFWDFENPNGDLEQGSYQWSAINANGTLQEGPYGSQESYLKISFTFSSTESGTFFLSLHQSTSSGIMEISYSTSGTFTMSDYSTSDLPPFNTYFSDDFNSATTSRNYWYDNLETT